MIAAQMHNWLMSHIRTDGDIEVIRPTKPTAAHKMKKFFTENLLE